MYLLCVILEFMNVSSVLSFKLCPQCPFAGIVQSVLRLATDWTILWSNPVGGKISHSPPNQPWGPPSLLYSRTKSLPWGLKGLGHTINHPPSISAIPLRPFTAFIACYRANCTFTKFVWNFIFWICTFACMVMLIQVRVWHLLLFRLLDYFALKCACIWYMA